jgi:predicted enzyme related to lactoylglutathione lyase
MEYANQCMSIHEAASAIHACECEFHRLSAWGRIGVMSREGHPYLGGELVVVIDCAHLGRSAAFWTGALGYIQDGAAAGRYQSLLPADGTGAEILLQRVPDGKDRKNRVHLDLRTRDLEPELQRLLSLGATLLTHQPVSEAGWRWYILADPDGNEFCVLQPPDTYWPDPW